MLSHKDLNQQFRIFRCGIVGLIYYQQHGDKRSIYNILPYMAIIVIINLMIYMQFIIVSDGGWYQWSEYISKQELSVVPKQYDTNAAK